MFFLLKELSLFGIIAECIMIIILVPFGKETTFSQQIRDNRFFEIALGEIRLGIGRSDAHFPHIGANQFPTFARKEVPQNVALPCRYFHFVYDI